MILYVRFMIYLGHLWIPEAKLHIKFNNFAFDYCTFQNSTPYRSSDKKLWTITGHCCPMSCNYNNSVITTYTEFWKTAIYFYLLNPKLTIWLMADMLLMTSELRITVI